MTIRIETGMKVRLLVDDITNDHQKAGMIGHVEWKEEAHDPALGPMFWVVTPAKRADGETILHRAPYFAEDLEIVADAN